MSIWSSISGEDPVTYETDFADTPTAEPVWFDVAVAAGRARIVLHDGQSTAEVALDDKGMSELQRRIVIARDQMSRFSNDTFR